MFMKLIDKERFNTKIAQKPVSLYTLKNSKGMVCQITNFGGRVVNLWVPDKHGDFDDVVLGYDSIDGYLNSNEKYFGAIIGRFGNRIANSQFSIDGKVYNLAKNDGKNSLHSGLFGFHNQVWNANQISKNKLELIYISVDGEEGFPGNLSVKVTYILSEDNALDIECEARTDKITHVNLTHHSYFNLSGLKHDKSIEDYRLQIQAEKFTPLGNHGIPTGDIQSVKGTPLDFRQKKPIGKDIDDNHKQIKLTNGYDHNYVLNGNGLREVAKVEDPFSGRIMEVITNEPGMQFYSANFLNGADIGKDNVVFKRRFAFCLETQHYPNTPNQLNFPSTLLAPEETYHSKCVYKFSVAK